MSNLPTQSGLPRLLLATSNSTKIARMTDLVAGAKVSLVTPTALDFNINAPEEGTTHLEIAEAKALSWSAVFSGLVLATDGGIVIPELGSAWTSLRTHRFAGPAATDNQRVRALSSLFQEQRLTSPKAYWIEAMAIAQSDSILGSWMYRTKCGIIKIDDSATSKSDEFWASKIWYFPQFGRTYSELSPDERTFINDHWVGLRKEIQAFLNCRNLL